MGRAPEVIPRRRAAALALAAQGLHTAAPFGTGPDGAARALEHLGYAQIDTIAVVERAHHHVLYTRVPDYRPEFLDELAARRRIFEYWTHAAAVLPMAHLPHHLPEMRWHRRHPGHWSPATPALREAQARILRRLRREGPLALRDLEATRVERDHAWSSGKLEKPALHELWMQGRVAVAGRRGFEKLHDLPERVWPKDSPRASTPAAAAEFTVRQGLAALGLARARDLHHLRRTEQTRAIHAALARLARRGEVREVRLEGSTAAWFALESTLATPAPEIEPRVRFLSPFDNLIIHRDRAKAVFGLDYKLECYTPEAKRDFAHFALPVLCGDGFAGLLDLKAEREKGELVFRQARLDGMDPGWRGAFAEATRAFARFNGCDRIRVERAAGATLRAWL